MRYDLVVPKIHVERQFIVDAMYPESGHIADNTFQRAGNDELCRQEIRENPERISRLLVLIVLGFALDSGNLAAFVCVWIRHVPPCIKSDLGIQPSVSMGRIFQMILLEQDDRTDQGFSARRGVCQVFLPIVEAAALNPHFLTKHVDRKLSAELQDYLVLLLLNGIKTFSGPSPFTS